MSAWAERLRGRAAIAGGMGIALLVVGLVLGQREQFFRSYLIGYVFWLGIAFGALGIQMIHALTGGRWGPPIRRALYAASTTMPLLGLLFVPLVFGMEALYPWARPEAVNDHIIQHKAIYLNVPFFLARAAVCLAVWSVLALVLYKRSVERGLDQPPSGKMRVVSGPGILVAAITMSIAAIDWLMSLDPHWFSTMFGVIVIVGNLLSAMCFVVALTIVARHAAGGEMEKDPLHDLGNLMLVFVMLWAYVSYSQYLIIYAGNMSEDVIWYAHRAEGGWETMAIVLIALHFALPFVLLISRRTKRNARSLVAIACLVLVMRLVEGFWTIAPNFYGHHLHVHWMDLAAPLGIGGIWLAYFFHRFGRKELEPVPELVRHGKEA